MYVDSSSITVNHKTYTRHLLRTSFRKDGKVKHRTIANISSCSDEEIQAVKLGLKYKGNLAELASLDKSMKLQQGLRVGAVWVLLCLAKQLHIVDALGAGRQAKLALWQIIWPASSNTARACPPCAWPALTQFVNHLSRSASPGRPRIVSFLP